MASSANSFWQQLLACPGCGTSLHLEHEPFPSTCPTCKNTYSLKDNCIQWHSTENNRVKHWQLLSKLKNQFHPLLNFALPFRYLTHFRVENYYHQTLTNSALAEKWATHYLKDLDLSIGSLILDHGCGRGRIAALAQQRGYLVCGQEINAHSWWKKLPTAMFQVVPPHYSKLPWQNNSFSAILNFNVLHYLNEINLHHYLHEVYRVLKPGGYFIALEANASGYASYLPRKHLGRLHTLERLQQLLRSVNFSEISISYEGVYLPPFPLILNFLRQQVLSRSFDICDFGSRLERLIPARRRALWLLRLQKNVEI